MPEIQVPSGKQVLINPAPFQDAMTLKSAIGKAISGSDVEISIDFAKELKTQEFDLASIVKLAALVDSDAAINEALMKCLIRCTYDGEKITMQTFEPVEAREDYYPIVLACLKENIGPFFKSQLSRLLPAMEALKAMAAEKPQKSE